MGHNDENESKVNFADPDSFAKSFKYDFKETFFPDDPFRQFKNQPAGRKTVKTLQYFAPILEWGSTYTFSLFRSDLIAGITIASLAIPQGISYAKLGSLPPILGLYSSFVPPLIYAIFGSSKDLAVGTVAAASMLLASQIGTQVSAVEDPILFMHMAFTATFFAGVLQATLGFFRLGILTDFLSHSTIIGFMGGTAIIIIMQQLKGFLGLVRFTTETDVVSVMHAIFTQTGEWKWEPAVIGICFLALLLVTRYISKKRPRLFWISAMTPLLCVVVGSVVIYVTRADKRGIAIIGELKKGLNPLSIKDLKFESRYLAVAIKSGMVVGFLALCEGIAVGRSFAILRNDQIDGNKEMIAYGMMNIAGSFTSCYLTTGPFSKSAVNFNSGCKTPMANIVQAIAVMLTLLFLTPLFHYTPLVALSAIITSAMLGLIDYTAAYHLFQVDKFDFVVCMAAFIGVVFFSMDMGLMVSVGVSLLKALLYVARPRTSRLGKMPNGLIYRDPEQYPAASNIPGLLILQMGSPLYFANSSYMRERITRYVEEEEESLANSNGNSLQYVILDMSGVTSIDTCGINMLEEVRRNLERREIKVVVVDPRKEVMGKFILSSFIETIGKEWIFLTIGEAVSACRFMFHTKNSKNSSGTHESMSASHYLDSNMAIVSMDMIDPKKSAYGNES